jgi:hypothetical protein
MFSLVLTMGMHEYVQYLHSVYCIFGVVLQVIYGIHMVVNFQRSADCNQAGRGVCW